MVRGDYRVVRWGVLAVYALVLGGCATVERTSTTATIDLPGDSTAIAIDPDTRTAWVGIASQRAVSVIDTTDNSVVASVAVDGIPIAITVGLGRVFVTHADSDTVSVLGIDDRSVLATVTVGRDPGGLAVDPLTGTVWVANTESDTVSVIDADSASVVATIAVGSRPRTVGSDPRTRSMYVANYGGSLSVIDADTRAVTSTIPIDASPIDLAVGTEQQAVCYSTYSDLPPNDNTKVQCVDAVSNARLADIDIGHRVGALAVDGRTLYAADRDGDRVSVVDLAEGMLTKRFAVGTKPIAIAIDTASNAVYVINGGSDTISVAAAE